MEVVNICRCCLSPGLNRDLNATYVFLGNTEVYADMLNKCFNISLSSSYKSNSICDACIGSLRSALHFRQQVLDTEQQFLNTIQTCGDEEKPIAVKLEPKQDSGDDSDDYFLADTVKNEIASEKIKVEKEPKKKPAQKRNRKSSGKKAKPEGGWRAQTIESLVHRLTQKPYDMPEITIKKKDTSNTVRKITIIPDPFKDKASKVDLMWASRTSIHKGKHRENLQTILKFSNATPFKNKSLIGYICGYCDSSFQDPVDLRSHTDVEHKKERLIFKSNFDMTEYNVKVDITDLICTLCDSKMNTLGNLKEHLVKVHKKTFYTDIKDHILQYKLKKGDVYDCAMCSATYETFKMLKQHMNKHYCNYSCPKCDTSFATKRSLNAHRTTHQEGSFKCDQCEKVFASKTKKHYHEKTKHLGARNISNCPYCNEPFRSYYQRNQHLIKVHNAEAQYKCNVCQKSYILKSLLMYHIKKNHLMERNCQCTECGFRFFSKKALKAHMVKHTGERNFACEVCHKSYARKYTLREHMRIHNNDRRFKCDVCAMSFVQKCSLKSHLLSNHGISMAASDITSTSGESQ